MKIENLVPKNIQSLQPYEAGKTIKEVRKRYEPKRISKLASNENRLGCSEKVNQAIMEASREIQDYPDPLASNLRQKLADLYQVSESEILLGAGSESIIGMLCRTFFKDDENAVTANGTFVGFFVQSGVRGIQVKKVPLTKDYRFDVEGILDAVDGKTKMIYIANPNNPTGTYITKKEYRNLLDEIPENVLLVMDEAYHEYSRSVVDYPNSLLNRRKNVITLRTFSKAYGLAGMRVGYAIAQEELIEQMIKTKLTFEPTRLGQAAAKAAMDDQSFVEKSVKAVIKEKEKLYDFFDEHEVRYVRSIANSVMMILEDENAARSFTEKMMKQGVILRRTHAFKLPNCIRITIGTEEEMNHFKESYSKLLEMSEF
ncbi:histidinol-phosphate transaminase [Rhodohalobacter sulfatireducens]|uniref:Histidinol-phosphate aminotransferase n=1 Tax=Rhodohalobacter sulfatireducens TaxID=2911366 RepID=A0ABS9KEG7_9BACT|nr:histidinol-phosphate transaminase [Rhodohalobacter sulfatireducens]MCG2589235.1 histidinol-phosphate transaminase [Rhodohalobacter sulfatireducens]